MTMSRRLYDALAKYNDLISQAESLIVEINNDMSQDVEECGHDMSDSIYALQESTLALNGDTVDLPYPPPAEE